MMRVPDGQTAELKEREKGTRFVKLYPNIVEQGAFTGDFGNLEQIA